MNEKFGPLAWEPLLYVCYARLPIASAAENSLAIARALLDAGANPNVTFDTEGSYAFSALTGVVGEGEGTRLTQPPHPRAEELAKLLIERGADPYDPQTLYNTSLAEDDVFWLDFLYRHSLERGDSDKWVAESARWPHSSMLDYLLGNAVAHNHLKRAGWLLERGARAAARGYYDKVNLHTKAVLSGDTEMASLLARHGAEVEPLEGYNLFYAACMTLDRVAASRYAEQHPEYLLNPTPMLRAAAQNRTDILAMLFELGASANAAEEPSGLTPLHAAARHDAAQAAQYLISRGAHVDVPDRNYDSTPLGWALYFDKREAARVIAEASCAIRPLTAMGYLDRLRVVLADRSEPLTKDDSAALFALPEDETVAVDIARLLLAHGADPRVRNENGSTPAEHAAKRGLDEVAEMLEDRSI